jgi:hypothetical protein
MAPVVRGYSGPLEPSLLTSEAEWRKLKIDVCPKEESEEELGMSVVLLSGRKNPSLWSRRYHLATGLSTNMRSGLVTLLGSHGGRNSAPCPH